MSIFSNTELAFRDKTDAQLHKALIMFQVIQYPLLTKIGSDWLNFSIKMNFPFVESLLKNTLFDQFCGGETRQESKKIVDKMYKRGVGSILDYSVEGKKEDSVFDAICNEIKSIVNYAEGNPAVPFVVFKPTAFGHSDIYEFVGNGTELTGSQQTEWNNVKRRYDEICSLCYNKNVIVMIDAEETWIQDAVDSIVEEMKEKYNKEKPIVWNTIQMYRTDRLQYMRENLQRAKDKNYFIGYKIVRGAYMEKERERAKEKGYISPIQPTKEDTDKNYNESINFVLENLNKISAFFGTHNEYSTELLMDKMKSRGIKNDVSEIHFGQLYGMSDNITYYLADEGYNVSKYLPYGPVKDVTPYLLRRAEENTSVRGQTGKELNLIKKELIRRKKS